MMKPMFSYFGSKYKCAKHYGPPRYNTVVEPFAGSAAYSLFWEPKNVILIDKNPIISGIWRYLIGAEPEDINSLPVDFNHVDEIDAPDEAKNLIGFWIGKGKVSPGKTRSKWGVQYANSKDCKVWNDAVKKRLSEQVLKIKHWKILQGDYISSPDVEAHWFIDPPYALAGKRYPVNDVDYNLLAAWATDRKGYVQVCENSGANWLPFKSFRSVNTYHHIKSGGQRTAKYTEEVLFTSDQGVLE